MAKLESEIQQLILLEAPKLGITLWRNNSGALKDHTGRVIRYGLANTSGNLNAVFKSSDLIGISQDGKFLAIECKREDFGGNLDARGVAQKNFIDFVIDKGGCGGFASSVAQFRKIVGL